jgi:acyl homoserine lactone synthase
VIDVITPDLHASCASELRLMFQQRYRVFRQRLSWRVADTVGEERDSFDACSPVYLLAYDAAEVLTGSWRFLPTTGPYMLRDVFPQLLEGARAPYHPLIWEGSRFAVESRGGRRRSSSELLCAVAETCIAFGIRELITVYDARMERLLPRLGCPPKWQSRPCLIGDDIAFTGRFDMNHKTLSSLRSAGGIQGSVIRSAPFLDEPAVA